MLKFVINVHSYKCILCRRFIFILQHTHFNLYSHGEIIETQNRGLCNYSIKEVKKEDKTFYMGSRLNFVT